ncbi:MULTISPECIES: biliverdin-producing heme oxygenase [unclassified Pseudomonas]|uniref:biliverdin-producing heme oxygenase n=1 Tax=unclassified Pseudomonas TaxID=196821 RepID=UPI002AC8A6DA|nr:MULTISPECIES: biliverdin-producing heme oxygenase [unclassified Pseudomonas]MEB0045920.1 biliverdin-producing heme oxygenase [Pseudomonas sp. Dout3]MEB0097180.1 biliverdin-producing heme oxygenase [Pseudomonas sp. DC1.2]WPX56882.1 biliverdin-producing heme oxygenase [Pseudomonas sp. DC1.2]
MHSKARSVDVPLLLQDLRAGTAQLHIALEKRLPFFSATLNTGHYRLLIQAYYGFYHVLEQRLEASGLIPHDFDLSERLKTATLRRDLQALGLADDVIARLPVCQVLPAIVSTGSCLGVLYVLEGATLGGQILRREIAARLHLDADTGAAFLEIYGAATGRFWREFTDYLCAQRLDAGERHAAVSAAQDTFSCFERWLDRAEVLL